MVYDKRHHHHHIFDVTCACNLQAYNICTYEALIGKFADLNLSTYMMNTECPSLKHIQHS